MNGLTALILTSNERENIGRVLQALRWIPRVVVIDSGSTDETVDIVRSFANAEVLQRRFDTHARQWNYGLAQVGSEWVLTLDADYLVSAQLAGEVEALEPASDVSGYSSGFVYHIHGAPLRATVYPPRVILFRRSAGRYVDEGHTQALRIDGKVEQLRGKIVHDDRKPFTRWLLSQDAYVRIEAKHLLQSRMEEVESRKRGLPLQDQVRLKVYFAAPAMFLYLLFARGLILDGWRGWFYVAQRTIAELMLSVRLLIEKHRLEEPNTNSEKLTL